MSSSFSAWLPILKLERLSSNLQHLSQRNPISVSFKISIQHNASLKNRYTISNIEHKCCSEIQLLSCWPWPVTLFFYLFCSSWNLIRLWGTCGGKDEVPCSRKSDIQSFLKNWKYNLYSYLAIFPFNFKGDAIYFIYCRHTPWRHDHPVTLKQQMLSHQNAVHGLILAVQFV